MACWQLADFDISRMLLGYLSCLLWQIAVPQGVGGCTQVTTCAVGVQTNGGDWPRMAAGIPMRIRISNASFMLAPIEM